MESSDSREDSVAMDEESNESGDEKQEFMPGFSTVDDFTQEVLGNAVKLVRQANQLPQPGDDHEYYSTFSSFKHFGQKMEKRLRDCMRKIAQRQHLTLTWLSEGNSAKKDAEEMFDALVESNDVLLESASTSLDELSGLVKKDKIVAEPILRRGKLSSVASWNKTTGISQAGTSHDGASFSSTVPQSKNIPKPQHGFRDLVDNTKSNFVPLLRTKPNAKRPLSDTLPWLKQHPPSDIDGLISSIKNQVAPPRNVRYEHPYQFEIQNFSVLEAQLEPTEPVLPLPVESTPLILVDTEEALTSLVKDLKQVEIFAADLEHHAHRTYLGLTCLLQISTAAKDYIVDPLKLRRHMNLLNDPFTDPSIVKVLHGADRDVLWLQRDFGIYVVNLFDTHPASKTLGLSRHSLAHLLHLYCSVEADKQYQLADWRVRPLSSDMVKYAREDTHYLIYIYHVMKKDLLQRGNKQGNLMLSVINRSREVCLKKYEKPLYTENAFVELYRKKIGRTPFNSHQLEAFRLLFQWRDSLAREEDESTGYIMPNHMLMQIAYTLPREPQGVLGCCNPVPLLLRAGLSQVHGCVLSALKTDFQPIARLPTANSLTAEDPEELYQERVPPKEESSATLSHRKRRGRQFPATRTWSGLEEIAPLALKQSSDMMSSLMVDPPSENLAKTLEEIRLSFANPLEQFCTPSPTPPPLLTGLVNIRQRGSSDVDRQRTQSAPAVTFAASQDVISLSVAPRKRQSQQACEDEEDSGGEGFDGTAQSEAIQSTSSKKKRKKTKEALGEPLKSRRKRGGRQRTQSEHHPAAEEGESAEKKLKPSESQTPAKDFEPYNYSERSFKDIVGEAGKQEFVDPLRRGYGGKAQKSAYLRGRAHQRSGQKSHSYSARK